MKGTVTILNKPFDYDFLSAWIKYIRLERGISQEALAYGICSKSHLSYFENGKKTLRSEVIEMLLKKLDIGNIIEVENIGLIREKFYDLISSIESYDNRLAKSTYIDLMAMTELLYCSPYNIEFKIYQLMYKRFIERKSYENLAPVIETIDKIYDLLDADLKYLYMLVTGKLIYDSKDHSEGIKRLLLSLAIKDTPWINYRLGVEYCFDNQPLKGIPFLNKALGVYEMSGKYRNSLNCHRFLGICYTALMEFEKAKLHFDAVMTGADYFDISKNALGIFNDMARLSYTMGQYKEGIHWSKLAMNENQDDRNKTNSRWTNTSWHAYEEPILGACHYIEGCVYLNKTFDSKEIFNKYLTDQHKDSLYYNYLYFLYLSINQFSEKIFYTKVTEDILPYYKAIAYLDIHKKIQLKLIEYLKKNRRYKEATQIYKQLLSYI